MTAPQLTTAHLTHNTSAHSTNYTCGLQPILGQIEGHTVRYSIHIDGSYPQQSRFRLDVFSTTTLQWAEVWTLHPTAFYVPSGPSSEAELNPTSPLIASTNATPANTDRILKSWQKIVNTLHDYGVQILP